MIASLEDRADQTRELRVRADFEEGPGPHPVHRLDLGDELDRPGELAGQQGAGRLGVVGIGLGRRVGEDGNRRGARSRSSRGPRRKAARPAATNRL